MVGTELMRSLGKPEQELDNSAYDGVYASPEERADGGGCFSMNAHFTEWCGSGCLSITLRYALARAKILTYLFLRISVQRHKKD